MIKIAEKNVKDSGLTKRINCFVANGNKLVGFKDNYYDMIISTGALHSWKNPAKVINECYRVLKPGCEAWIFDPALIGSEEKVKLLKGFDMVLLKLLSLIPGEVMIVTYTETEIIKIIKNTKFKRYEIRERKNSVEIKLKK
jgi:ubiquinone/menaquinone biosynthesis C-methylase UbiE